MLNSIPVMTKAILVVDDNPDICTLMSAVLEEAGYEVRTAEEGEQALARGLTGDSGRSGPLLMCQGLSQVLLVSAGLNLSRVIAP